MSLQTIPREIRHTIARDYYTDVDMVNAHPVILEYLCKKYGFNCDKLTEYINNRESLLKEIKINGKVVDRDKGKQIYLALTNGGDKDFRLIQTPSDHLRDYKDEMIRIHKNFADKYPEEFKKTKEKRMKAQKDYNHEAGFMNTLLCDMENTLLMEMYKFFGSPEDAVLCFDGIMLRNHQDYDIHGCMEHLTNTFGIDMKIKAKTMDEHLDMSNCNITPMKYDRLDYYTDFRNLVKKKIVYPEWIEEWSNNSLVLIEGDGKQFYLTRNKRVVVFSDKSKEIRDEWKPVQTQEIEKSLKVKCQVINPYQDFEFCKKYREMKPKERKELNIPKELVKKFTEQYTFGTLGITNTRLGEGYLTYLMEERIIKSYNATDFFPFLKEKGLPPLEDTFNIFTEFPIENIDIETDIDFTESKLYTHLKVDFFNENQAELDHFLDHIADLIQDPARIKGTSHLFYSKQGCGKGMLFKFMTKLLGVSNVISIINTDTYFDKNFNSDVSNKLLKCFEEVSEKGSAFKNHDRLKGEQTSDSERVEPKGIDPYYNRHCARFWYFTNNENSLYIENDDRRHTLHKIRDTHANDYEYFKPIWEEIKDEKFLKSAFNFFKDREYEEKNVMNAFTNAYKKEQKDANLSNGIKFMIGYVCNKFKKVEDKTHKITSEVIKDKYKQYCESQGTRYQFNALNTQIRKIGILKPTQLRIKNNDGSSVKKICYKINTWKLQEELKKFLRDDDYVLQIGANQNVEEVDECDVVGYSNDNNCNMFDIDNDDMYK
jgi:hypothetical protein